MLVAALLVLPACHATQYADEKVNWLSDRLADIEDDVQRSLDRQ